MYELPDGAVPTDEIKGWAWSHRPPSVLSDAMEDMIRAIHSCVVEVDFTRSTVLAHSSTPTEKVME